jgi:orotidine-5'-phosphate decarboxylase
MNHNPLIVALDVDSVEEARSLVRRLGDRVDFYKVGMELYAVAGMEMVRELAGQGKRVFLDLKFYDIGETVKRATAQVARAGASFLTVHASAAAVRAAVEGRGALDLKILAVTVLTSYDARDLENLGYTCSVPLLAQFLAGKALEAGADGLITSPLEVASLRRLAGPDSILVTPGVRSAGSDAGDQKRVATPAEAIRNGADYLVMGRQITRAPDPAAAAARVLEEIAAP